MLGEVTELLNRMAEESGAVRKQTYDRLVVIVYQDLRRRARLQPGRERGDTLQPTALVLHVQMPFHNREHFLNEQPPCVLERRLR
jgi:hypothetical protein